MDAPSRVRVSGIAGPGAPTVSDDASSSSQLWDVALGVIRSTLAWAHRVRVRWSAARIGLVFCYHGVSARGGDPVREISAPVSHRDFERQLRHLRRRYRVVPALCLPAEAAARARGRRVPVAITFDDDLPSHLSHAAPALRRAKLPATFFLSGAGLNGPFSFWWQLLQALAAAGFEIGFHTRNHDDLLGLRDEELPVALSAGRAELERIAGPLSTISYPHGRADDRVAAAARAAGFRFGFVADGSPVMLGDDPHLLGRRYPARGAGGRFALDVASTLSAARPNPFSRRPRNRLSPR
jgi:peptidoglycan/xylan/chitin deacetylase (PgdA/CDA1 family)